MSRNQPMSIEAVLDAERKEVLALLEGTANRARTSSNLEPRSESPYATSPVRSMLDIAPVRSMLDVDSPLPTPTDGLALPSPLRKAPSQPSSPIDSNFRAHSSNHQHRSLSDAASRRADFGPRSNDPVAEYQFGGIITNQPGQNLPKRASQGGRRSIGSALANAFRNSDVSYNMHPGDRGRHYSMAGPSGKTPSKSPHNGRLRLRSTSPSSDLLGRTLSPAGRKFLREQNDEYDATAYRRLSDANMARSQGSLGELSRKKSAEDGANAGRLVKDYLSPDGELLEETSDDASSSEDEQERGRKAARSPGRTRAGKLNGSSSESPENQRKGPLESQSLLAAAEEERISVAKTSKYRSLLDEPEITVTTPTGERYRQGKAVVHPQTSFDNPPRDARSASNSGSKTPMTSDTEADITDIKRAQKLSFATTQIMDNAEAHRSIQIITRGEYSRIAQEVEDEHRTPRKYLVATDLSDESTHALEWAVGTVLRDGDQLLAIYCVDEELGVVAGDGGPVTDDTRAKEQANALSAIAASKSPMTPGGSSMPLRPLLLGQGQSADARSVSASPAPSSRERSKAEEERYRAVRDISDKVTKLLRKTRLQVRVIVEVLHCKNPRHSITEVIDIVNPTLVILGSRGRNALKGVILGSFSNYLVTKSSVPVMVARKRLRKHTKYKAATHQVNNISNPTARSLTNARID